MAIIIMLIIVAGAFLWFVSNAFIGYGIGMTLGIALTLAILRKLGRKARWSSFSRNVLYKVLKYKANIYHYRTELPKSAIVKVYDDAHSYADLLDILKKQMKIPASAAQEAAKYATSVARDKPFEEQIRVALQYWGNGGEDKASVA